MFRNIKLIDEVESGALNFCLHDLACQRIVE